MKKIGKSGAVLALAAVTAFGIFAGAPGATYADAAADNTIAVWLIGGQSNAVGYAWDSPSDPDSRFTEGFDNVLFWGDYECDSGSPHQPPTDFVPVTLGLGKGYGSGTACSGAEIGIASALADSGTKNAIIKCAWGATFLNPDQTNSVSTTVGTWTPPSWLEANPSYRDSAGYIGACYNWFVETVQTGLQKLKALGYTPVIRGMWWMQGEADIVSTAYMNAYADLLTALISDLRSDLSEISGTDLSSMPFVIGKIYRNPDPAYSMSATSTNGIATVRAAQQSVADNLFNVFTVDCTGLEQRDGWHFKADGQLWLGEQFVQTVLVSEGKYQVSVSGERSHITVTGGGVKEVGQTVTIICTPSRGYYVGTVTYREGLGEETEVTLTDGRYSFVMPEANVSLTVTEEAMRVYQISYTVNDSSLGSVYISYPTTSLKGWYDGESVQIGVLPKEGYEIKSITANGVELEVAGTVGEGYYYTVTENADVEVAVTFAAVEDRTEIGGGDVTETPAEQGGSKGCGSVLATGGVMLVVSGAAIATLACKKRKK